jgi:hypothetical protein
VDFEIPADLAAYLAELDEFIEHQIRPLERHGDNVRFFDHRREDARVAANVLGIVARDLELGAIPPEAILADHVAAKLAVANPGYFDQAPPA